MTLKELRLSKKLTQQQAADLLHINRRTYINYEQNKIDITKPRYAFVFDIINEYGKVDENHGILTIDTIKSICSPILKEHNVKFCILFGSYAKNKAKETSDIDLFVSMDTNSVDYFSLLETLREELHKKIDLIHETQLINNLELTKEIMKDGIKIYG